MTILKLFSHNSPNEGGVSIVDFLSLFDSTNMKKLDNLDRVLKVFI